MELKEYRFGEVTINFDKKRVPLSGAQREKRQGNFRYYGAQGVIDHIDDFIFDGTYLLIAEDGENLKSKKQNIAQVVDGQFWVNNHAHIVQGNELCNTRYLCYLLNSMDLSGYITGSAQPKLSQANLNTVTLFLPDIAVQERIVEWLYLFDKKIEVNKQINDNLFEQIQALYNSWFIEFRPFGGSKPRTWEKADIYELANIIYGAPFKSKHFNTEGIGKPIIRIRDLKDQKFNTYTTEVHLKGYLLKKGDIVVGMDGVFRPYIWGNDEAWLNQRVCVFKNKRPYGKAFLYFTIRPLLYGIEQAQVATTVIHIGKKDFDAFEITLPDSSVLDNFDALTNPLIQLIISNNFKNKKLAAIRDIILPKIMNSDIDVFDILI